MRYVFDSAPLIDLKHYYSSVFERFWEKFDALVDNGDIIAPREVYNEISSKGDFISDWAEENKEIFLDPTPEEIEVATEVLTNHPELIRRQNISGGLPVADPFVIAQAYVRNLSVVSGEKYSPNAHKIPNICEEYDIEHLNFLQFMEKEGWKF